MAVNVSGLRRNLKNLAHNYTEAQIKVREATSNDSWGPSSTLMSEIADLTYNVIAFTEIMQMIWKRLNDHGKNWRHVYKALILLEYLIKTGSEKVAQQCKENIFAIQTLKDFQYTEENKDQGMNVREKAKLLVALLKDDEKLKNERIRALKAKERFAQSSLNFMSSELGSPSSPDSQVQSSQLSDGARSPQSDLECARPQTAGEEELQLQLAIAMSKEEADQEEQKKKSDELRLAMAIIQSKDEMKPNGTSSEKPSAMLDLLDLNLSNPSETKSQNGLGADPWSMSMPHSVSHPVGQNVSPSCTVDPWGLPTIDKLSHPNDIWGPPPETSRSAMASPINDPWSPSSDLSASQPLALNDPWNSSGVSAIVDPWGSPGNTMQQAPQIDELDEFAALRSRQDNFQEPQVLTHVMEDIHNSKKTPESFLGDNLSLVNLDNLIGSPSTKPALAPNPFASPPPLFQQPPKPSMNEMRGVNQGPWTPQPSPNHNNSFETNVNPFLS